MKISVITLNYNGKSDTLACLNSLRSVKKQDWEVSSIVVDNASTDRALPAIKSEFPEVTVLANKENLGFAGGNNVGVRHALKDGADFLFLLNNDTVVSPTALIELVTAALAEKKGGIFGPKIYFAKGAETHPERYKPGELGKVIWYAGGRLDWDNVLAFHRGVDEVDVGQYDESVKTAFVSGCAMLVRREVFETVGLFDSRLYLYYEDVDLSVRARKKGYEVLYVPSSRIWHKNAGSSGGTGSDLHVYYMTRNRLIIGMRYAPWKSKLALMREALVVLMQGSSTQKQAVGDFLRKQYGKQGTMWVWKIPNINLAGFWKKKK